MYEGYDEANAMKDYLMELGVPEQDIFMDRITSYNVCYTKLLRIMAAKGRGAPSTASSYPYAFGTFRAKW